MSWLGLDIGGANLKAADGAGWARSVSFALWREPQHLAARLEALIDGAPAADRLAITMTGELCDCFCDKAEGVRHILSAVDRAADGRDVRVYQVDGQFVSAATASNHPRLSAASNWHALATFVGRFAPRGAAILIDIGSTTTDIVPLINGRVAARGTSDLERLACGELLYRGVGRTPICALCHMLPWNGKACPVAAEVFATTADAYVLLGMIEEDPEAAWTADGKPLTTAHAQQRLARQLCADASELGAGAIQKIASVVRDIQMSELSESIAVVTRALPETPSTYILSGSGEFMARPVTGPTRSNKLVSLRAEIGDQASECGPAHAVAALAKKYEN
jgi:probable H4MPT-linked C1 transfer pathway protein